MLQVPPKEECSFRPLNQGCTSYCVTAKSCYVLVNLYGCKYKDSRDLVLRLWRGRRDIYSPKLIPTPKGEKVDHSQRPNLYSFDFMFSDGKVHGRSRELNPDGLK